MRKTNLHVKVKARYYVEEATFACKIPVERKLKQWDTVYAEIDGATCEYSIRRMESSGIIEDREWVPTRVSEKIMLDLVRERYGAQYREQTLELTKNVFVPENEFRRNGILDLEGKLSVFYPTDENFKMLGTKKT